MNDVHCFVIGMGDVIYCHNMGDCDDDYVLEVDVGDDDDIRFCSWLLGIQYFEISQRYICVDMTL